MRSVDELITECVSGRRVLLRADLNVPLDKDTGAITDDGRIRASLPTLQALRDGGARVIVTAHLGRPKGAPDPQYSLAPVAARLSEQLAEPRRDRREGELRIGCALGPSEVGGHDHARAGVPERLQRGQRGPDAEVVGDDAVADRYVEVATHQDPLAGDVAEVLELGNAVDHRCSRPDYLFAAPTIFARSTRRLE